MTQIRDDLLNRIKEKHDLWFKDSMDLYKIAAMRPSQAANDAIYVMTYNIVWLLEHYDVDLNAFIKGLKNTMKIYRKTREQ